MTATTVFLSYARKDGGEAAARLRGELQRSGFEVWRDIEDMRGGQELKNQLRQAIKAVDAVLVILTPGAVASKYVEWEWEAALTLDKRVIPLMMRTCEVPGDLRRLHYHRLNSEQEYVSGFAGLVRDLIQLSAGPAESAKPKLEASDKSTGSRSVSIGGD
ncbi:MAG: toll/interleukin-1 receptor domain-containing protein [Elainellaceae cyanobacterium]